MRRGSHHRAVTLCVAVAAHMLCTIVPGVAAFSSAWTPGARAGARVGVCGVVSVRGAWPHDHGDRAASPRGRGRAWTLTAMRDGPPNLPTETLSVARQIKKLRRLMHRGRVVQQGAAVLPCAGAADGQAEVQEREEPVTRAATPGEQGHASELLNNFQQIFAVSDAWIQRFQNALRDPHSKMVCLCGGGLCGEAVGEWNARA